MGLGLNITDHSLRIGGCTAAAAAGIPMEIIPVGHWGVVQRRNVELHSRIGCSYVARDCDSAWVFEGPLLRHSLKPLLEKARLLGLRASALQRRRGTAEL